MKFATLTFILTVFAVTLMARPSNLAAARISVKIAGFEVNCRDTRGNRVQLMKVSDLGDVGRAWVVAGVPFIVMDTELLRTLPAKLRLFFYGHECAHHVLGHWYAKSGNSELEADCWAIKDARDRNLFNRDDVSSFAPFFARSRGTRWGHLPGPERAKRLLACYDEE